MITIVVTPGGCLTGTLYRALSRSKEVLCVSGKEIMLPDMAPDILLVESVLPLECDGDAIYVLGAPPPEGDGFSPGPRAVGVIQSQNTQALAFAAKCHLKTLTCGLSSHDTLTLSSLTEDSAVVCLQREVATIGGGVKEPAEIPVRLNSPLERFELLALAAVLLLCGEIDRLSEPL